MKLKTLIDTLEKARERYIATHGIEPHIANKIGPILCAEVDRDCMDQIRHKKPIVELRSKCLEKFMELMK